MTSWLYSNHPHYERIRDILLAIIVVLLVVNAVLWITAAALGVFNTPVTPPTPPTPATMIDLGKLA